MAQQPVQVPHQDGAVRQMITIHELRMGVP